MTTNNIFYVQEVLILVCVEVSVGEVFRTGNNRGMEVLILVCVEVSVGGECEKYVRENNSKS